MLNKEKLNANNVETAAHSDPQTNKTTKFGCRGGRLCPPANKQNGITLIALIITIIVMLILVGVTINVALNGGLFEKAKTAATKTEEQSIYDQIVGGMDLGNNGKILVKETYSAAKNMIQGEGKTVNIVTPATEEEITNSVIFDVVGNNGTYTYTITEEKIIIGKEKLYSFTLNDLGECSSMGETGFAFDPAVLWNVIGEDLSNNDSYCIKSEDSIQLVLETDDTRFAGFADYVLSGGNLDDNVQFIVLAHLYDIDGDIMFYIEVFDSTGNPHWNSGNEEGYLEAKEFLNTYGDVVFKFVDVSSIELQ